MGQDIKQLFTELGEVTGEYSQRQSLGHVLSGKPEKQIANSCE